MCSLAGHARCADRSFVRQEAWYYIPSFPFILYYFLWVYSGSPCLWLAILLVLHEVI